MQTPLQVSILPRPVVAMPVTLAPAKTMKAHVATASPQDTGARHRDPLQQMVHNLSDTMDAAIEEICDINADTKLLSLNARIEAARAGKLGAAFGVVASEMQALGAKTAEVAEDLASRTKRTIDDLMQHIGSNVRGTRLSDLALTCIDLVDRNLYERTCDVRWWATDSSIVDALSEQTPQAYEFAARRMGVILNAYTVYHDLVLADADGHIVANGRPGQFASEGADVRQAEWFRSAMRTSSGDQFGFESAHRSALVGGKSVLAYSCSVRAGGNANGRILGVLGVLFNWEDFAQTIVEKLPLADAEKSVTRCVLCDEQGRILADSRGEQLTGTLALPNMDELFAEPKNFTTTQLGGKLCSIAHAQAPGFETYSTDWHAVIIQPVA